VMAKPSFDEFADMLDRAVDRIPPKFCRELTGGFNVQKGKNVRVSITYLVSTLRAAIWVVSSCFIMVPL
jgi:hypothetical protein